MQTEATKAYRRKKRCFCFFLNVFIYFKCKSDGSGLGISRYWFRIRLGPKKLMGNKHYWMKPKDIYVCLQTQMKTRCSDVIQSEQELGTRGRRKHTNIQSGHRTVRLLINKPFSGVAFLWWRWNVSLPVSSGHTSHVKTNICDCFWELERMRVTSSIDLFLSICVDWNTTIV